MPRINNARTIADIEYVIEAPGPGSELTSWSAHGVTCRQDRHRFSGQGYSFSFEIVHLSHEGKRRQQWQLVIVSELWRFKDAKGEPRGSKSLKVINGKTSDILSWMRLTRGQKPALKTGSS